MKMMINSVYEINTIEEDVPYHYLMDINNKYRLSILTGSHAESSTLETLEIALLKDGEFFDGTENSIIHYIPREMAHIMINEIKEVDSDEDIEEIFKVYQDKADERMKLLNNIKEKMSNVRR